MIDKWIDSTKAQYYTNKSSATINRLISRYKNDKRVIRMDNNKPLINSEILQSKYPFTGDNQMSANDNLEHQKDFAELTIQKQEKDIINKLIESQQKPFSRLPVLWVSIGFVVLIVALGYIGYMYRTELLNNFNSRIANYQRNFEYQKESITKLKKNLSEKTIAYEQSLKAINVLHVKYNDKLDEREEESKKELTGLEKQFLALQEKHGE